MHSDLVMRASLPCLVSLLAACTASSDLNPPDSNSAPDDDPASTPGHDRHIALNHIALNHIALNGLIGNFEANRELTSAPLRTETFERRSAYPLLRTTMLKDAWSREFLSYVVSCALNDQQSITVEIEKVPTTWTGALALCPAWGNLHGSADIECQERVSACILARVNKLGQYVPISPRGAGLDIHTMAPSITSVPEDQLTGLPISALSPCPAGAAGFVDCGWRLEKVLTCTPGDVVHVGAGGHRAGFCEAPVGSSTNDTILRVTEGVRARNRGPAPHGILPYVQMEADDTSGTCGNLQPYLEFTCGNSGVYSVMTASYQRREANSAVPGALNAALGDSEPGVFREKEGGFYGNIFRPDMLGVQVYFDPETNSWRVFEYHNSMDRPRDDQIAVTATIFQDMWTCSAPDWTKGEGYFHSRLCALPASGEGCAATWVGICGENEEGPSLCAFDDTSLREGHGGWNDCLDGLGHSRQNVISAFLASQCDAVPDRAVCGTLNNPMMTP